MLQFSKIFLLSFLLLIISLNVAAQERYVSPVDEGKTDASFNAFREKLISAVKNRDTKYLLSVLDRNIKSSFGGDNTIEDFKRMWKIDSPKSKVWGELLAVLTNGGKFTREGNDILFSAPYSFTHFPDDLDAFEYRIIFGNNINLRAQPDLKAKTVARLSYHIVKVDYENSVKINNDENEYSWLKVETLGGKKGFVKTELVRSPIDYRAIFEKQNGKWKMITFIAGD